MRTRIFLMLFLSILCIMFYTACGMNDDSQNNAGNVQTPNPQSTEESIQTPIPQNAEESEQNPTPKNLEKTVQNSNSPENANLNGNKNNLKKIIKQLKDTHIGSVYARVLYASDEIAVVIDYSGIVIYDFGEKGITDVILFQDNEVMGRIDLQGSNTSVIYVDADESKIYFVPGLDKDKRKSYYYDLKTKEITETTDTDVQQFDKYSKVKKSQLLSGRNEDYYFYETEGVWIDEDDFIYLINTSNRTNEGLTLVRLKGKKTEKIPLWE